MFKMQWNCIPNLVSAITKHNQHGLIPTKLATLIEAVHLLAEALLTKKHLLYKNSLFRPYTNAL